MMALKSCPECHGSVSDQALACPHCGRPLAEDPVVAYLRRRIRNQLTVGYALIAAAIIVMGVTVPVVAIANYDRAGGWLLTGLLLGCAGIVAVLKSRHRLDELNRRTPPPQ